MYNKYLEALNELNNTAISLNGNSELEKLSLSDKRWALDKRNKQFKTGDKIKRGEVYQFEFGKNNAPEISYEHRGLVIGVDSRLLHVLPIFSFNPRKSEHQNAHHATENHNPKSNFFLLKSSDFDFIRRDSVLKLNDLRTISVNRMQYKHDGRIDINSKAYAEIESLVIQKYFHQFFYEHMKLKGAYIELEQKLQEHIAQK